MEIKKHYHDALNFASSYINENKDFHLTLGEKDIINKLIGIQLQKEKKTPNAVIDYSNAQIANFMWYKTNTVKKLINQLGKKEFINIENKVKKDGGYYTKRKITINWNKLIEIADLIESYKNDKTLVELPVVEEPIQPETNNRLDDLLEYLDDNSDNIKATKKLDIQNMLKNQIITSKKEINEMVEKYDINRFKQKTI